MVKDKVRWKGVISQGPVSRGEVKSAFNICIIKEHLDDDYALDECEESKTTEQGWLVVGRLEPKIDSLPLFVFRWDEKDNCVDVDIKVARRLGHDSSAEAGRRCDGGPF